MILIGKLYGRQKILRSREINPSKSFIEILLNYILRKIRIKMKDGKPVGGYEDFVSGWLPEETSNEVWGRPVGLLMNSDGSLLICDDGADKIWRVSYQK